MEAKQTMLLLSGLPGSGKSREAQKWLFEPGENPKARINYDDMRLELLGQDFVWTPEGEKRVKKEALERAERLIEAGYDLVIDNCNLTEKARGQWKAMASRYAMDLTQQEIDTPVNVCVSQDKRRVGRAHVGRAVIERMALFNGFIDWTDPICYPRDFVIVDMDGTVADCSARKAVAFDGPTRHRKVIDVGRDLNVPGPCHMEGIITKTKCPICGGDQKKDWDLFYKGVENDPPIRPIVELVRKLSRDYDLLIVSGRPTDKAGMGTEKWLDSQLRVGFPLRHLFMRAAMDNRPDYVIKKEILDLLPKGKIAYAIDDRDQVVKMWRENGITTLQVAEGDF